MILELKHIYKDYLQGKLVVPVLKDINLSVEAGEYIAIMGPSGSGKTTLMNIIGCLDVANHSIGFVFQQFNLLPKLTAQDNVALPLLYGGVGKKERRARAKAALEKVGLGDRVDFRPNQMSGGQCQRVAIARAIVGMPKLLLADEPTGALDSKSGEQVMELFRQLNDEGMTIVMITHDADIAKQAKKTYHIFDGEIRENQKEGGAADE